MGSMIDVIKESSTRIKTAVVLIILVFGIGIIDNIFLMWFFLGIVLLLAISEIKQILKIDDYRIYTLNILIWLVLFIYPNPIEILIFSFIILASILAYTKKVELQIFTSLLYPTASFLYLFVLYKDFGIQALLWLLVIVAGADIGAYFVGKKFGKTPFCPTSPKKTIEGVLGGIVLGTIIGTIIGIWNVSSFYSSFIVSFVSSAIAVFGDLYASLLKREAGVKDSGNIFPGHGGMIDRVDGYFFSVISMFALLQILS